MVGKPVRKDELADILQVSLVHIEGAVRKLKEKYKGPMIIRETSDTVFMTVEDEYMNQLWYLGKGELSAGELKTLAMVAYYAPVKQSDIVRTRGNRAYEQLSHLEEMGLLRREKYANTKLLKLSKKFYEYFGDEAVNRIRRAPTIKIDRTKGPKAGENIKK